MISIITFPCYIHKGSGLNFCLSTFLFLVWSNGKRRIEFLLRVNQDNLQCDSVCRDGQTRMLQSFLSYSCVVNNTSSRNQTISRALLDDKLKNIQQLSVLFYSNLNCYQYVLQSTGGDGPGRSCR